MLAGKIAKKALEDGSKMRGSLPKDLLSAELQNDPCVNQSPRQCMEK